MFMNNMRNQCVHTSHRVKLWSAAMLGHNNISSLPESEEVSVYIYILMKCCNVLFDVFTSDLPDSVIFSDFLLQPFPILLYFTRDPVLQWKMETLIWYSFILQVINSKALTINN